MNFEAHARFWGLAVLLAGGAWLGEFETSRPAGIAATSTPLERLFALSGPAAQFAADASWLRLNLAWERREETTVRQWIELTTSAAPTSAYFRINAARMLAFDVPVWREEAESGAPAALRMRWREHAAAEALQLLSAGPRDDPLLVIEQGRVALYALHDRERAAELFRKAAEMPGAPWHAGRIHAQLLRELGRDREALEWLREWLPQLPAKDPAAQRDLVVQRIAELELELRSRGEPL